jgi:hypothetical protein
MILFTFEARLYTWHTHSPYKITLLVATAMTSYNVTTSSGVNCCQMIKILTSRLVGPSGESAARGATELKTIVGFSRLMFGMLTGVSILTGLGVTELIIMRDGHDPVARGGLGRCHWKFHFISVVT